MKICRVSLFVVLMGLLVFAPGSLKAQNKGGAITLSPLVGGYVFEGNQYLKDKVAWGLGLGYNIDEHWATEAVFNYIDTEYEVGSNDVETSLYRLDALYHFMPSAKLVPYVAAGVGGISFNPDAGQNDTDFLTNYGVGLKYFFTENIAFRGDARHVISFDDTQSNLLYTAGLTFLFGGKKDKTVASPMDSDGDGVMDSVDKCPDTPRGAAVDRSGCPLDSDQDGIFDHMDKCPNTPIGVPVDRKGCPMDSDGDGVYDSVDKCPNTPKGVRVNKSGCPPDSDGDGVPDYLDQCISTPSGVQVDQKGCPLDGDNDGVPNYKDRCPVTPKGATVNEFGCWVCKDVNFDLNKWDIKPEFHQALDEQVRFLKANPELIVEVQGHTCNIGKQEYNQMLSEKRATSVMNYFIDKGISKDRLSAKGYGMLVPLASNDTKEGRKKNRRVQLNACYDLMMP